MNPFADMPTHVLNDVNVALWIVFFIAWAAFSVAQALTSPKRGRK